MKRSLYIFLLFFVGQVLLAFFAFGFANFSALIEGGPLNVDAASFSGEALGFGSFCSNALLILSLLLLRLTSPKPFDCFRKGLPSGGALALVGFLLLSFGMSFALSPLDLADFGMEAQFEGMKDSIISIVAICILAPVAEELVFREGILREMQASGAKPWIAIMTSALCFAVVHGNPMQMVPAAVMGVALGWLYYRTGDVRLCIPAHILNNSVAMVEMHFPELDKSIEACSPFLLVPAGALLIFVGASLLSKLQSSSSILHSSSSKL